MQRIPGDERERGSLGNRLRVKPLCPEVARHQPVRKTRSIGFESRRLCQHPLVKP
jgi:hypothetical protein